MTDEMPDLEKFIDSVQDYVETRSELGKLQAIRNSSKLAGGMAAGLIIFLIMLIVLLFLSVAAAYAISEWLGKPYTGFLCVGGFYLLLGIILYSMQDSLIKKPLMNNMIRTFFRNQDGKN